MQPPALEVLGVPVADDQARAIGLVLVGVLAAVLVLAMGRRARRLVLGLVLSAAVITGLMLAVRAGIVPDPRTLIPGLSS